MPSPITVSQARAAHTLWIGCEACDRSDSVDWSSIPHDLDPLSIRELHFGCHLHCTVCELPSAITTLYIRELHFVRPVGTWNGLVHWPVVRGGVAQTVTLPPKGV